LAPLRLYPEAYFEFTQSNDYSPKSIIILPTLIFISSGKNKNKEKLYNPITQIKNDSIGIILNNKNNLVKWIYSFRNGDKKN